MKIILETYESIGNRIIRKADTMVINAELKLGFEFNTFSAHFEPKTINKYRVLVYRGEKVVFNNVYDYYPKLRVEGKVKFQQHTNNMLIFEELK